MQLANQQKANLGRYGEYGGCLSLLTDRQILIQIGCEPHLKMWLNCSPVLNKLTEYTLCVRDHVKHTNVCVSI